jgi:single-strand DNA-binding protein
LGAENINRCIFSGNLTRKPDLKDTAGGSKVCRMRLAVNSRVKRGGEWTDKANYLDIVAFGRTAENCAQYLDKGSPIMADCRADWSEWQAQDGSPRQGVAFIADNVQFLGSGSGGDRSPSQQASDVPATGDDFAPAPVGQGAQSAIDDDIPF